MGQRDCLRRGGSRAHRSRVLERRLSPRQVPPAHAAAPDVDRVRGSGRRPARAFRRRTRRLGHSRGRRLGEAARRRRKRTGLVRRRRAEQSRSESTERPGRQDRGEGHRGEAADVRHVGLLRPYRGPLRRRATGVAGRGDRRGDWQSLPRLQRRSARHHRGVPGQSRGYVGDVADVGRVRRRRVSPGNRDSLRARRAAPNVGPWARSILCARLREARARGRRSDPRDLGPTRRDVGLQRAQARVRNAQVERRRSQPPGHGRLVLRALNSRSAVEAPAATHRCTSSVGRPTWARPGRISVSSAVRSAPSRRARPSAP